MNDVPASSGSGARLGYLFSRYPVVSHTFIDNEILGLEERGRDIVVLSLSPPKNDFRHGRLDRLRAPVVHAPPPAVTARLPVGDPRLAAHLARFGGVLDPEKCWRHAMALAGVVRALGIGHLHVHFANRATLTAYFLRWICGVTYSFTPQAADFLVDLDSPELLAELASGARAVIAPCEHARGHLVRLCPSSEGRIRTVYNGIEPSDYQRAAPRPGGGRLRIVSIGRFEEFKGFHHVIEAVALARDRGVAVEFFLQGDGPWRARLEELARGRGVADRVRFEGIVGIETMRRRFAEVDAFVLACLVDARGVSDMLPTVITEAMLSGLPVVSCPVAGVPEQVVHGETGLLVESGSPEALCDALCRLAAEPGLAARLGANSLRRGRARFSIHATLPRLEDALPRACRAAGGWPAWPVMTLLDLDCVDDRRTPGRVLADTARRGGLAWVAPSGGPDRDGLSADGDRGDGVLWMPDGMALEMEWQHRRDMRAVAEAWRTRLGDQVDGEDFLRFARRAVWLAIQIPRLGGCGCLEASDRGSVVTAWLVGVLTGIPARCPRSVAESLPSKLRDAVLAVGDAAT